MIDIRNYLSSQRVIDLKSTSKDGAIMELVALSAECAAVEDAEKLQEAIFTLPYGAIKLARSRETQAPGSPGYRASGHISATYYHVK